MLRRFTQDQFSDSGTIDGNRLSRALAGLVRRFNALERADVEAAWVETKYVAHFRGSTIASGVTQPYYPFVQVDADGFVSVAPETLPDPSQRWRHKGIDLPGLFYNPDGLYPGFQYAWTHSFWFERPAVLQRLTAFLQTDDEFTNTFVIPGGGQPPPGYSAGDSVKDFQLLFYVANPFLTENASQDAVELLRRDVRASEQLYSPQGTVAAAGSMLPAADDNPGGVVLDFEFHEVCIPSKSRVYMALVLPQYDSSIDATPWADETVWRQFYSLCLTALEPVE